MTTKKLTDYLKQQTPTQSSNKTEQAKPAPTRIRFKKETEFQETPIGKIPKEWRVAELQELGELVDGYAFPLEYQGRRDLKYLFVKVSDTNIRGNEKYIYTAENTIDDVIAGQIGVRIYPPGTIIFPKIGEVIKLRKVRILARYGTFDNNLIGVIPNEKSAHREYLYYYLLAKVDFTRLIGGSTAPALRKSQIAKIKIALPPITEQKAISEILSTVDSAIEKVRLLIDRAERLKKGLMQELLTKGIGHKEFQETPIGKIPKEWKVCKLGQIVSLRNGRRPTLVEGGTIPVYGANGIMGYTDTYMVDDEYTLVIGRVGAVGQVHIGRGKIWISDNAIYTEHYDRKNVFLPFLYYFLITRRLEQHASRTTHPLITQTFIENIMTWLPPIEEQKRIAEILLTIDEYIETLRGRLKHLEHVKRGLMEVLLTGKVRVMVEPS